MILALAFVLALAAAGQVVCITALFYLYQTMKKCMFWVYMALVSVNLVNSVLSILTLTDSFIVYAIILFYHFLAIKVMFSESAPYRSNVRTHSGNAIGVEMQPMLLENTI
jgi:hypothetical protein